MAPLRAPVIVVVVAHVQPNHPKIPTVEQVAAVAAAAHCRDADNVNSGIAEQFVHAVLVDQYASAAGPDEAPQQAETTSSQLFWVSTLDCYGCVALADVDTAEEMCGEPDAIWKRGALCDPERAHR